MYSFLSDELLGRVSWFYDDKWFEKTFLPHSEIVNNDGVITIYIDLPGADKEDITVEVDKDILIVKGQNKRSNKSFMKQFSLSHGIKIEDIKAKLDKGVLEITINKSEELKPKKIMIE